MAETSVLDYDTLRQTGIRYLERMAGQQWTDFNIHDPGITILEQCCYALTDLLYRCDYSLPDLLTSTGEDTYASLYAPAQILSSQPVTLLDLRKHILDVPGVKNAWIEPVTAPQQAVFFQLPTREVSLQDRGDSSVAMQLQGLYRVLIEKSELADWDGSQIKREVARRLHAHRALCEDFDEIKIFDTQDIQDIQIQARIEIGLTEDAEAVLLAIYQAIAGYFSPPIPFYRMSEGLAAGKTIDDIVDGPPLLHGFIDTEQLRSNKRKSVLHISDLIHAVMDVPGVMAVKNIVMNGQKGIWSFDLGPQKIPRLDLKGSTLALEKKEIQVNLDKDKVIARYYENLRYSATLQALTPAELDLVPPPGRDRQIGRYFSLQHQFPAVYGIGALGLPPSASPERQAQARQLKAYLLFFDQILANAFAQLGHARGLFSFQGEATATYFPGSIDDPTLSLDDVLPSPPVSRPDPSSSDADRRRRLLDHLLARYAEQFAEYTQNDLSTIKRDFLRQYPRLSSARGTAFNYLLPASTVNRSGLEQRLRLKLGQGESFYLVEHILLRPMAGDEQQIMPLLSDVPLPGNDPYSLQFSLFLPVAWQDHRTFIEQTVREETPAHLSPRIVWLEQAAMAEFERAYRNWQEQQRSYWRNKFGLAADGD